MKAGYCEMLEQTSVSRQPVLFHCRKSASKYIL